MQKCQRKHGGCRVEFKDDRVVPDRVERFPFDGVGPLYVGSVRRAICQFGLDEEIGREGESLSRQDVKADAVSLDRFRHLGSESLRLEYISVGIAKQGVVENRSVVYSQRR